jgi:glycosyltransferase 2 family protein
MSTSVVQGGDGPPPLVLIDEPPTVHRSRRPMDAARLAIILAGIVLVLVLSLTASRTVAGIEGDLNEASALVPDWVLLPLTLVAAFATLTLWIGFIGLEIAQRRGRTAAEMVMAGILTAVVLGGLSVFLQSDVAPDALASAFRPPTSGLVFPTSAAATVALVSIVGWTERPWVQRLSLIAVIGGVTDLLLGAQVTPQGAAFGLLTGRAVALTIRLVSGVPTDRPDGATIAAGLVRHGIHVRTLTSRSDAWPRVYSMQTDDEELDLVVLDRDREGTGLLSNAWQWLRLRGDILPTESVTMRGGTDQRALAAHALREADVRTPHLRAAFALGPDAIALVYQRPDATRLVDLLADPEPASPEPASPEPAQPEQPAPTDDPAVPAPPDAQDSGDEGLSEAMSTEFDEPPLGPDALLLPDRTLDDLWNQVRLMHASGIAHRQLAVETIALDEEGHAWILEHFSATVAASSIAMSADVAQLLVLTASIVGPRRAVAAAVRNLGRDAVGEALPLVQPLALPSSTRARLKSGSELLERLRDQVRERAEPPSVETISLERLRPRVLLSALSILLAVYLVGTNLVGVDIIGTVTGANPWWILVALVAFALSYLGAAWGLVGFVPETVPLRRVFTAQIALGFVRLVAPSTLGIAALNTRLLVRMRIPLPSAAASVAASQAAAFIVAVPLIIVLGLLTGREVNFGIRLSTIVVAVGAVVLTAAVVLWLVPAVRTRAGRVWRSFVERGLPRLLDAVQDPRRLAMGLGGNLMLTLGYGVALYASVAAVGAEIPIATATLIYVSGNAVGSIVPTPGGLGAVEAALTAGLTAAGIPGGEAFTAVILFRLITFWLPIPIGWFAWNKLQRAGAL